MCIDNPLMHIRLSLSKMVLTWVMLQQLVGADVPQLDRIVRASGRDTRPTRVEVHLVCIARMPKKYGKIQEFQLFHS